VRRSSLVRDVRRQPRKVGITGSSSLILAQGTYCCAAQRFKRIREEEPARGGDLIELELKGASSAILADWQSEYDMTAAQVDFAKSLCDRKLEDPARPIRLSPADAERLNSTSRDAEGLGLAREMFARLDIVVP
jgi:hypothetical protein